jgi:predicted enzyme related to lactoylglutathione lyase
MTNTPDTTLSAAPCHPLFMDKAIKTINWFEIPALDLDRASAFYEQILNLKLIRHDMGGAALAVFPYDREHATGGTLMVAPGMKPSTEGSIVYLNAGASLDETLARIAGAGGAITTPRTPVGPGMGFFALIHDTEGNRVGLHAFA